MTQGPPVVAEEAAAQVREPVGAAEVLVLRQLWASVSELLMLLLRLASYHLRRLVALVEPVSDLYVGLWYSCCMAWAPHLARQQPVQLHIPPAPARVRTLKA